MLQSLVLALVLAPWVQEKHALHMLPLVVLIVRTRTRNGPEHIAFNRTTGQSSETTSP